jgi:hypothetical protein
MQPLSACSVPETAPPPPEPPAEWACPVCRGRLLPLGNLTRCTRCLFTLCAGCEGAPPNFSGPGAD